MIVGSRPTLRACTEIPRLTGSLSGLEAVSSSARRRPATEPIQPLDSLWPLSRAVSSSTLAFSCIRMRNAEPEIIENQSA
jgi:hypothetical protein